MTRATRPSRRRPLLPLASTLPLLSLRSHLSRSSLPQLIPSIDSREDPSRPEHPLHLCQQRCKVVCVRAGLDDVRRVKAIVGEREPVIHAADPATIRVQNAHHVCGAAGMNVRLLSHLSVSRCLHHFLLLRSALTHAPPSHDVLKRENASIELACGFCVVSCLGNLLWRDVHADDLCAAVCLHGIGHLTR